MSDFLIIGGGVSGMLVARGLSHGGASVQLVERGECGREASWAGGGIVSPLYPWRYSEPVTALANRAQDAYPELAQALADETGIDPELSICGLLMLDAEDHVDALQWAQRHGRPMQTWQAPQIYAREPGLASGSERALYMPTVANVRNPRLVRALAASLRLQASVDVREQSEILRFETDGERLTAVWLRHQNQEVKVQADAFVLAAGAWTGLLLAMLGQTLPVTPVKGQMLLYKADRPLLSGIVLSQGRYLIPRRDHHILVGSTLEHSEFDKSVTAQACDSLRASAEQMLPVLSSLPVLQQWAGLRPGSPDGIPFIGKIPGFSNVYVNAGHYRNGLVLAPASADLLVALLTGTSAGLDPEPYDPGMRGIKPVAW
ncbi:glycine oxidase ThiO [Pseudohongiella sp.]|uniref:FAD dependent oxidoreductase domain-containing protein n=1 Tax=marine sediment metagenome TaxID=412755 RepID=A0A0F9YLK1_9ZZZZ